MTIGQSGIPAASSYFAVFQEGAFGSVTGLTAATGATAFEPMSFSIIQEIEPLKLDTLAKTRGFTKRVQGNKTVSGTIEQHLHAEESALFLINAMAGTVTSAAGSAGSYTHSITAGDYSATALASLSIKARKGSSHFARYYGGRVNQLTITGNVGETIKMSADVIFKDSTLTSSGDISANLSLSAEAPFVFTGGNFIYAATTASLTTTNKEFIENFELTINNNLEEARALGQNTVTDLPPKRREIGLKVTQRFDTLTAYDRFIAQTSSAVRLQMTGSSLTSDDVRTLQIDMPKVLVNSPDPTVDSPNDILKQEFECDVLVDTPYTTTGKDIAMTLINAVASY